MGSLFRWPGPLLVALAASVLLSRCDCAPLQPGALFACEADGSCPEGKRCGEEDWLCVPAAPPDGGAPDACVPDLCAKRSCGSVPDGCGGTLDCGECLPPLTCGILEPNRCGCAPDAGAQGAESECADSVDNDCDSLTDCEDPDCDGRSCDDQDACTQGDTCSPGKCEGAPQACDRPPPCRSGPGTCAPATGECEYPPAGNGAACEDGNACTIDDRCLDGACQGEPKACTAPSNGCVVSAACDPGNGGCRYTFTDAGTPCADDGNLCTNDVCNGAGGCIHPNKPESASCDDGNACTTGERCSSGVCLGGTAVVCATPPANGCLRPGVCDPASGACRYLPKDAGTPCSDGDLCTTQDLCQTDGGCAGAPVLCDRPGECEYGPLGTCHPADGGCTYTPKPVGTQCDDGLGCTFPDTCRQGGVCGGPSTCMSGNPCLVDPGTCTSIGCVFDKRTFGTLCNPSGTTLMCGSVVKPCYFCVDGTCVHNSAEFDSHCAPTCAAVRRYCGGVHQCCPGPTACLSEPTSDCKGLCCTSC